MASYIITYDLSKPGRNYTGLYDKFKAISGTWAHIAESSWFVAGDNLESEKIVDTLSPAIDNNDKLFVGKMDGKGAWTGLTDKQTAWLKKNL